MNDLLVRNAVNTIDSYLMLSARDSLIVALSGGADSVALLVAMAEVSPRHDLKLAAAHVHHGLRGAEADQDAAFAERITAEIGQRYKIEIAFYLHTAEVKKIAKERKLATQEAGRLVRDAFLRDLMQQTGATKIATGHTASDNAETFLMRLITGGGPEGLSGIPPIRLPYIRPLIGTTRTEVEAFLADRTIAWIVDSSNLKNNYLRNRVRNEIMPALVSINPNIERTLIDTVTEYRQRFAVLKSAAEAIVEKDFPGDSYPIAGLASLSPDLLSEVVKLLVFRSVQEKGRPLRLLRPHIEAVTALITSPARGEKLVPLPGGLEALRTYDSLTIGPRQTPRESRRNLKEGGRSIGLPATGSVSLPLLGAVITTEVIETNAAADHLCTPDTLSNPAAGARLSACFDLETIPGPLVVRTRRPGDRIYLEGCGTRKLSDFFIDRKIPRDARNSVPLVAVGADVLWVVGMRVDERFSVTPATGRILRVIYERCEV